MARKVDRQRERIQAAIEGKAAPDLELDLNEKTVQDWGNIDSGDRPPHLVLLYITQLALAMRPLPGERAACLAAVDFVEQHLGRVAFALPEVGDATAGGKARTIAYALAEFAEFIDAVDDPAAMSPDQKALAHQQLTDVVASCFALMPATTETAQ